uniref:40S ribosomal protein S15 n=1 Tax=Jaculus jaculus TaxID=51337 RepID=A0A8C5LLV4_JACJA
MVEVEQKKRTFRKLTYHGVDLDQLLDMSYEQLMQLYSAGQQWRRNPHSLLKRLLLKTHLHHMITLPEMVGSMVGVYDKTFNQVEINPSYYLGEFSTTYKPVKHGWPGTSTTHSSRFIPLK